MNIEKIVKGISSSVLGIVLLFVIWKQPHPQFNTLPNFFIPAYYTVLIIVFSALIINGLLMINSGKRNKTLAEF